MTPSERALWLCREFQEALTGDHQEADTCAELARQLYDAVASGTCERGKVIAGALLVTRATVRAGLLDNHKRDLAIARAGIATEVRRAFSKALEAVESRGGK